MSSVSLYRRAILQHWRTVTHNTYTASSRSNGTVRALSSRTFAGVIKCPIHIDRQKDIRADRSFTAQLRLFSLSQAMKSDMEWQNPEYNPAGPIHILCKYTVPPSKVEAFADLWKKVKHSVSSESGNSDYYLHKTMHDNIVFYLYGAWKDGNAFKEHVASSYAQEFHKFHEDNGVLWEREFVTTLAIGGEQKKKIGMGKFHVLINYKVLPKISNTSAFIEAFKDHAHKTVEEEANHEFVLTKTWDDNTNFYAWGNWESQGAYDQHWQEGYTRDFLHKVASCNVSWFMMPAWSVGQSE